MEAGGLLFQLEFGLPEAVEIAVGIYCDRLLAVQDKGYMGCFAGIQNLSLNAVFGHQLNPFDPMYVDHGMIYRAYIYFHDILVDCNCGDVLFAACLNCVGDQLIHLLSAAEGINARIIYHLDDVAAAFTDIKLCVLHILQEADKRKYQFLWPRLPIDF